MTSGQSAKVHVDLPNHWATGGESMWARELGGDLYELENIPFYAYGLNYKDVVRATASADGILEVREVVRPSGHKTLRVMFSRDIPESRYLELMHSVPAGVSYERATGGYFALDLRPGTDIWSVCEFLDRWVEGDIAGYETCEPRVGGSFDDSPQAEERE